MNLQFALLFLELLDGNGPGTGLSSDMSRIMRDAAKKKLDRYVEPKSVVKSKAQTDAEKAFEEAAQFIETHNVGESEKIPAQRAAINKIVIRGKNPILTAALGLGSLSLAALTVQEWIDYKKSVLTVPPDVRDTPEHRQAQQYLGTIDAIRSSNLDSVTKSELERIVRDTFEDEGYVLSPLSLRKVAVSYGMPEFETPLWEGWPSIANQGMTIAKDVTLYPTELVLDWNEVPPLMPDGKVYLPIGFVRDSEAENRYNQMPSIMRPKVSSISKVKYALFDKAAVFSEPESEWAQATSQDKLYLKLSGKELGQDIGERNFPSGQYAVLAGPSENDVIYLGGVTIGKLTPQKKDGPPRQTILRWHQMPELNKLWTPALLNPLEQGEIRHLKGDDYPNKRVLLSEMPKDMRDRVTSLIASKTVNLYLIPVRVRTAALDAVTGGAFGAIKSIGTILGSVILWNKGLEAVRSEKSGR